MSWLLVDVLISVLAVGVLAVALLTGFLHVKQLKRAAKAAGERVGAVTTEIEALQRHGASSRTP